MFVIGDEYEILVNTKEPSLIAVERAGETWVLQGAYLTLAGDRLTVQFTDTDGAVCGEHLLKV